MRYLPSFTFSQKFPLRLKNKLNDLIPYCISDLCETNVDEVATALTSHPNNLPINVNCCGLIEGQDHFKFQYVTERKILLG